MIQFFAKMITRRRGLFLTLGAIFFRLLFLVVLVGSILISTQFDPQDTYTFRHSEVFRGPSKDVVELAFRDDGKWLAASSKDGNIFLWDFSKNYKPDMRGRARIVLPVQEGYANDLLFTHDNRYLITAGTDQQIKFWDTTKLDPENGKDAIEKYVEFISYAAPDQTFLDFFPIKVHEAAITKLVLSDDQKWLASSDSTGIIYLWDLASGLPQVIAMHGSKIDFHHHSNITDIEFSPSGNFLAISDQTGEISLWNLAQVELAKPLKEPVKVFDQKARVSDITFDLSFQAETPQSEHHLFSVGADERVHIWPVEGDDTKESFTFAKLHESMTVKVGITRDKNTNDYWLITADKDGLFIFWDLNKLERLDSGRINDDFFLIKGANREVSDLVINRIHTEQGFESTNRYLMVTGSLDRSAQVWILSNSRGNWIPVQLQPGSGKIMNVVISPNNEYILTAGTDNTIRFWETSHVANPSRAFPTTAFLRYLIPAALALVFALHTTSTFIMKTHNIVSRKNAIEYILSAMFGFSFSNIGAFLLSLFFPIWPRMFIENGKVQLASGKFIQLDSIGGPGRVVIRPGNVVSFQTIRTQTAVCTNQTYFMRPFERVRHIVSLEDQFYEIDEIETYTRDGILITIKKIRVRYRVKFKNNENNNNLQYRARYQNYPDPVDPEALDKALEMRDWNAAVELTLKRKITHFVNMRPLDYFTAPQTYDMKEEVRENFRNWVLSQNQPLLNLFGAEVFWLDVGVININPDLVHQTRLNRYTWQIRREADILLAQGASRVEAYRELGRLKGEAEILKAIIEEMDRWKTEEENNLPDDETIKAANPDATEEDLVKLKEEQIQTRRTAFLTRMSEILRSYLRFASSNQGLLGLGIFKDSKNPDETQKKN